MPRNDRWPFQGDSPITRVRRVALAARAALHLADPAAGEVFDTRMIALGQGWIVPRVQTWDDDDILTPAEAADVLGVRVGTVAALRRRRRLTGTQVNGRWSYRAGDVYELAARPRRRTTVATDTLPANGTSVPTGRQP